MTASYLPLLKLPVTGGTSTRCAGWTGCWPGSWSSITTCGKTRRRYPTPPHPTRPAPMGNTVRHPSHPVRPVQFPPDSSCPNGEHGTSPNSSRRIKQYPHQRRIGIRPELSKRIPIHFNWSPVWMGRHSICPVQLFCINHPICPLQLLPDSSCHYGKQSTVAQFIAVSTEAVLPNWSCVLPQ